MSSGKELESLGGENGMRIVYFSDYYASQITIA